MTRFIVVTTLVGSLIFAGCDQLIPPPTPQGSETAGGSGQVTAIKTGTTTPEPREEDPQVAVTTSDAAWKPEDNPDPGGSAFPTIKQGSFGTGSYRPKGGSVPGRSLGAAVKQLGEAIVESRDYAPTRVVWILDQSDSAEAMVGQARAAIKEFYQSPATGEKASKFELSTAVMAFGLSPTFVLEEPSSNSDDVISALNSVKKSPGGSESTFAALKAAVDKYGSFRGKRHEVMFVVVTDESGDDLAVAEDVIASTKAGGLPIYVIGVPAPFGRAAGIKGPVNSDNSIRHGPETRYAQRIQLDFPGDPYGLELIDSGFGPFHLERVCRASGGGFLALRPEGGDIGFRSSFDGQWPSAGTVRFPTNVMREYEPKYVSEDEYNALLAANGCLKALHKASQLPRAKTLTYVPTQFYVRSEAELANDLSNAQKEAAKVETTVDAIYQALREGEAARGSLTNPRWQASYDLAMGRICAAKVRAEGYNGMLALMKRGRTFKNANSNRWMLEAVDPADMTDATSSLKKLGEKARTYLQSVIAEHDGTPWAMIAERELNPPNRSMASFSGSADREKKFLIGWNWVEKGPNE